MKHEYWTLAVTTRKCALALGLLVAGLAFGANSAYAQAWQNVVVKAGQNKAITVPAGKVIEFLPPAGTPHLTTVKIEYTGENVMSVEGDTLLKPPTFLVGPVIITASVAASPPGFLVITYRLKVNQ
jgi:hypothetical protein